MTGFMELTALDPIVARDGRPFGVGQGRRMRGLPWPLPSVVAGAFRTAIVKTSPHLDFSDFSEPNRPSMPDRLKQISVAGVFPCTAGRDTAGTLYLPAPVDALAEPEAPGAIVKKLHRLTPQDTDGGCLWPVDGLKPVMLSRSQSEKDFKPAAIPAWWPLDAYARWLSGNDVVLNEEFLENPVQEVRDHVALDSIRGVAAEGLIFTSTGLVLNRLPRYGVAGEEDGFAFYNRYAEITLSARIEVPQEDAELALQQHFSALQPLGGERRLIHWQPSNHAPYWACPENVADLLGTATQVRMVLATPAIFKHGWRPDWLGGDLVGKPPGSDVTLRLVGVCSGRWKAVSGWSLAKPRGPKAIRRMVPAGSVYYFTCAPGAARGLTNLWLRSVCDDDQERRDGFGLATWGIW